VGGPGPLGRALLEEAGYDDEAIAALPVPARQNESLSPAQLDLMREINALDLPFSVTGRIADAVERRPDLFAAPERPAPARAA
jgi:hypothetical protein